MARIICFFLLITSLSSAQTDWEYWSAAEPSYVPAQFTDSSAVTYSRSISGGLISTAKALYSFFISDLDGDNCPFHPTCSHFFVEASAKTNILKGALMFADRFTRDINIGKSSHQYKLWDEQHYWDPVNNYLLDQKMIDNIPISGE